MAGLNQTLFKPVPLSFSVPWQIVVLTRGQRAVHRMMLSAIPTNARANLIRCHGCQVAPSISRVQKKRSVISQSGSGHEQADNLNFVLFHPRLLPSGPPSDSMAAPRHGSDRLRLLPGLAALPQSCQSRASPECQFQRHASTANGKVPKVQRYTALPVRSHKLQSPCARPRSIGGSTRSCSIGIGREPPEATADISIFFEPTAWPMRRRQANQQARARIRVILARGRPFVLVAAKGQGN